MTQLQADMYKQLIVSNGFVLTNALDDVEDDGAKVMKGKSKAKSFQNLLMQLRKVCVHPYMFPESEPEGAEEFGEHLV